MWVTAGSHAHAVTWHLVLCMIRGDLFTCAQIDLRKAREREVAMLDEKSTSSGIAEPYARYKLKARTGGKKGRHL